MAVTVVSDRHAEICERISGQIGRGGTVYRSSGGRGGVEGDILCCVVTRLEMGRVKAIVRDLAPARRSSSSTPLPAPRAAS
jgi:uncharacterized membrane-anchored protein YitT (DUF2179 family)